MHVLHEFLTQGTPWYIRVNYVWISNHLNTWKPSHMPPFKHWLQASLKLSSLRYNPLNTSNPIVSIASDVNQGKPLIQCIYDSIWCPNLCLKMPLQETDPPSMHLANLQFPKCLKDWWAMYSTKYCRIR